MIEEHLIAVNYARYIKCECGWESGWVEPRHVPMDGKIGTVVPPALHEAYREACLKAVSLYREHLKSLSNDQEGEV